jgi:hypothetical protein
MDNKFKQFINTLKLTPNIKLFGVKLGMAGHEFGAVNVKSNPDWTKDDEIPSSKAVKTLIAEDITTKVDKIEGKELSDNNYTDVLKALTGAALVVDSANLLPQKAYVAITYPTDQEFVITAVTPGVEGEDISIEFVNPNDVSQTLAVSYDDVTKTVTVLHSTGAGTEITITDIDGDGSLAIATSVGHGLTTGRKVKITGSTSYDGVYEITVVSPDVFSFEHVGITTDESGTGTTIDITTTAGSLETALNTDVDVSAVITSVMGDAGNIDFEGSVQLSNYVLGRVAKIGEMFLDATTLYIANVPTNGTTNQLSDFKTITLDRFYWRDEYPAILVAAGGAKAPDEVDITIGGVQRRMKSFDGGNTEEVLSGSFEIPHDMVKSTLVLPEVHVHWRPATGDLGVVKWFFDWEYSPPQAAPIAMDTVDITDAIIANNQHWHKLTTFGYLPQPSTEFSLGGKIGFNIRRTPADGQDTYTGDALLEQIALHVLCDNGSREIYVK